MMTCTVKLNGHTFVVTADSDGEPTIIKGRKLWAPGKPWECWYNVPYWHGKHHAKGKPGSLIAAILEEARMKLAS